MLQLWSKKMLSTIWCTFKIIPTPADAVVTINGEVRNSVTLLEGSKVSWSVEAKGYAKQSGEVMLNEDTSIDVVLEEKKDVLKYVGVAIDENNNAAIYSSDAITWNSTTLPASQMWRGVGYGNGRFVAVGSYSSTGSNVAAYSDDGINWNKMTMPSKQHWTAVRYANGRFMVYIDGSNILAYSDDGINWKQTTISISDITAKTVTHGNGRFIALGYNTETVWYSDDGIKWTKATTPSGFYWMEATYGNGRFVITTNDTVDNFSTVSIYSDDGINWKQTTMPSNQEWGSVTCGNGRFVALSGSFKTPSNVAAYSDDGINWKKTTMPFNTSGLDLLMHGNGRFVRTNAAETWYSNDGINWKKTTTPNKQWTSIVYG